MFNFNSTHIITGYIKQLLHDFNLPYYRIYTVEHAKYFAEHGVESPEIIGTVKKPTAAEAQVYASSYYVNYIKNNSLQKYVYTSTSTNGRWETSNAYHYHYNKKELNQTRNLKITNNVYDAYTHEYLGNYLRFIRDYHNINLMPLYNCFSNVICTDIKLEAGGIVLDSSDTRYKIYMLPVKLFKQYTIAIDSSQPVEMICGFYDKYLLKHPCTEILYKNTYKKYTSLQFNIPVLYNGLSAPSLGFVKADGEADTDALTVNNKIDLAKRENSLKLFIKLPASCNTSITILEGDYTHYNDYELDLSESRLYPNRYISNYAMSNIAENPKEGPDEQETITDILPELADRPFEAITRLQLLNANSGISYPFADRLIEYLLGNAITDMDTINDNITRAQAVMKKSGYKFSFDGLWDDKMRRLTYDYMNTKHPKATILSSEINHDILGYIDKDVERYYTSWSLVRQLDRDGNPIPTGSYLTTEVVLQENSGDKLLSVYQTKDLLLAAAGEPTTTPIYKEEWVPTATIANVDIYDGLYNMEDK